VKKMITKKSKEVAREKRRRKIRGKIIGTAACPRLVVSRSLKNITAQIIDDAKGVTLVFATTLAKGNKEYGGNIAAATKIGAEIAAKAKEKGITEVVFDRGGRLYHGRVAAVAAAAREGGLNF
jgi:large subunit ribosomal protein L18